MASMHVHMDELASPQGCEALPWSRRLRGPDATLSRKHWLEVPGSGASDKGGEESCHTSHTIEGLDFKPLR